MTYGRSPSEVPVPPHYRVIVGGALLTAFFSFVLVYQLGFFGLYDRVLGLLGVPAIVTAPFIDIHGVLSAAECYNKGIDVYLENPCDIKHRVHIYSPLWLKIVPSSWTIADTWWTGTVLGIVFLLSLAWLCPARSRRELWLFLALCCSSSVAFVVERANIDIVVFLLLLIAGKAFASEGRRAISYGAILLATALKFYPFAAFALIVADRPRRGFVLGGLAAAVAVGLAFLWRREIAIAATHFPVEFFEKHIYFSARNLVGTLLTLYPEHFPFLGPHGQLVTALLSIAAVAAAGGVAMFMRRNGVRLFLGLEETALYLGGATVIIGCFFAGHSHHYRAILLLLTVPLLFACLRDASKATRWTGMVGLCLVAFALFENFLRLNLVDAVSLTEAWNWVYRVRLMFWALEQMVWWTLIVGLMSAVFLIAWDSPVGLWARRAVRAGASTLVTARRA